MTDFLIGDEVSFVSDNLRGRVIAILGKDRYTVELSDGFDIPVSANEIVLNKRLKSAEISTSTISSAPGRVSVPAADKAVQGNVVSQSHSLTFSIDSVSSANPLVRISYYNQFSDDIFLAIYTFKDAQRKIVLKSPLKPSETISLPPRLLSDLDLLPDWEMILIEVPEIADSLPVAQIFSARLKASNILKADAASAKSPRRNYELLWIRQEEIKTESVIKPDPVAPMISATPAARMIIPDRNSIYVEAVTKVIDLHINTITTKRVTEGYALNLQMERFTESLERAIVQHEPKIIFIHGLGSGILKSKIRDYLGNHKEVEGFDDADSRKFGQGATEVTLKIV